MSAITQFTSKLKNTVSVPYGCYPLKWRYFIFENASRRQVKLKKKKLDGYILVAMNHTDDNNPWERKRYLCYFSIRADTLRIRGHFKAAAV
jgi:hypothetical protein